MEQKPNPEPQSSKASDAIDALKLLAWMVNMHQNKMHWRAQLNFDNFFNTMLGEPRPVDLVPMGPYMTGCLHQTANGIILNIDWKPMQPELCQIPQVTNEHGLVMSIIYQYGGG